ncbi:MAG TPA: M35 family metallo-endopeptidase [Bacteriovoracaceae bacterium]|nr:M35 family metallo-endopeptidase [Bacteriovoracaceae bacterium]
MKKLLSIFLILVSTALSATVTSCDPDQKNAILGTEKEVMLRLIEIESQWVNFRLDNVKRNFVLPQGRSWVNAHPRYPEYHRYWTAMGSMFTGMRKSIEGGKVNYKCHSAWQWRCEQGKTVAYVLFLLGRPFRTVHICPGFFDPKNHQSRAATLLHELSHSVSSTEDLAMAWSDGPYKDLDKASRDAHHVEEFQMMKAHNILLRTIWIWLFPKAM